MSGVPLIWLVLSNEATGELEFARFDHPVTACSRTEDETTLSSLRDYIDFCIDSVDEKLCFQMERLSLCVDANTAFELAGNLELHFRCPLAHVENNTWSSSGIYSSNDVFLLQCVASIAGRALRGQWVDGGDGDGRNRMAEIWIDWNGDALDGKRA